MTDTKQKRGKQTHDFFSDHRKKERFERKTVRNIHILYGTCINNNKMRENKNSNNNKHSYWRVKFPIWATQQHTILFGIQENTFAFFRSLASLVSFVTLCVARWALCVRYVAILSHAWNKSTKMIWSHSRMIFFFIKMKHISH